MKSFKKIALSVLLVCAMLLCLAQMSLAAGISVSAGQGTVSVGKTVAFSITVPSGTEAWTYSVSYSDNLSLESGDTAPMGFEGDNRTNQLVFRANSAGTGSVWISAGSYCIAGVDYDASGSASVTVVAASEPDDSEPPYTPPSDPPTPAKSSNNALSSLTVSAGTLTPAFDPAITDYTLSLPLQSDRLTITAAPSDSRATIQGDGEFTLQGGENTLSVTVTAEDGSVRTYTIAVKVAQAPTLFLEYKGQRLGVVKDVSEVTPPAGFTPGEPVSYNGDILPTWTDASGKHTLIYLVDEKTSATGFYLFSTAGGVQSPYLPLLCGSATYIYTDIPQDVSAVPGLTAAPVQAFDQTLNGWTYADPSLQDFCVLYLMDSAGKYGFYTYDSREGTLQRFNGAVYANDAGQSLRVPMLYVYIAGGAALVLLILLIVFASVAGSRGKKLRLLPDTSQSRPVAEQPDPDPEPEVPLPPEEPTPSADAPEPSVASPEAPPDTPASKAPQSAPTDAPGTPDPSLEDTLRHLPLDELLRDIHDL